MIPTRNYAKHRKYRTIARDIAACAFCDNGAMISLDDIAAALDTDRGSGFADPTPGEVILMIQGGDNGEPPPDLCVKHPALNALLIREMT